MCSATAQISACCRLLAQPRPPYGRWRFASRSGKCWSLRPGCGAKPTIAFRGVAKAFWNVSAALRLRSVHLKPFHLSSTLVGKLPPHHASGYGPLSPSEDPKLPVCFRRCIQLIAATHSANFSAGVWYCKVLRGRSLSWRAMALNFAWEWLERSVPLGRYWRSNRLVFRLNHAAKAREDRRNRLPRRSPVQGEGDRPVPCHDPR